MTSTVANVSQIVSSQARQAVVKLQHAVREDAAPPRAAAVESSPTAVTARFSSNAFKVSISKAAADLARS